MSAIKSFDNIVFQRRGGYLSDAYREDISDVICALLEHEEEHIPFQELKKQITWRKKSYKQELDSGVDGDGIVLSETNKMIVQNLYNVMCALESCFEEKK